MLLTKTRTAPTGYEKYRLLFHSIRTTQFISSLIVASLIGWFVFWLRSDGFAVPWTFIVLLVTSFATVAILCGSLIYHLFQGMKPRINLLLNTGLLFFWSFGLILLSVQTRGTLANSCITEIWREDMGVNVCRIYKTSEAFTTFGTAAAVMAVILDFMIKRQAQKLGVHSPINDADRYGRNKSVSENRGLTEGGPRSPSPYNDGNSTFSKEKLDYENEDDDEFEAARSRTNLTIPAAFRQAQGYVRSPSSEREYDTAYHGREQSLDMADKRYNGQAM